MKIKSYFSRTIEDALALARQELGPEAMLVNSRPAPPEVRHLGEYEVVFAVDRPGVEIAESGSLTVASPAPVGDALASEVALLKRELEGMRRSLERSSFVPAQWIGAPADVTDAYQALIAADISAELAREIVTAAEARLAASASRASGPLPALDHDAFQRALGEEVESRFSVDPTLGRNGARPRITALVGPPGVGKTTSLVKLAVNYGLACRRPVMLLSADTYRVAAAEQLRSYAAILGVAFQVLDTVAALAHAIEESRGKDLILIDTPGYAYRDLDAAAGLAQLLSTRSDIDTQLVVSASTKPADLSRAVDAYEIFRPQRLLFTRLDETGSFGPILNEAARTGKPLSFFATGQRVPEDMEEATKSRLAGMAVVRPSAHACAAA
jgi:flagellar biosynthesis protein FlhF